MQPTRKSHLAGPFLLLLFVLFAGCGGSKPAADDDTIQAANTDDYSEIERILGITEADDQAGNSNEQKTPPSSGGDDDDLLKLLQPQDNTAGENTSGSGNSNSGNATTDSRMVRLQNEVDDLSDQLREKNKTIADLKARIMIMEADAREQQQALQVTEPRENRTTFIPRSSSSIGDSEYESEYQRGYDLLKAREYDNAREVFESLLAANSRHKLADNAQYWIGECYLARGQYNSAIISFEKVFTYRNSNKNDYAQFQLGVCYFRLKKTDRSRQEFQAFLDNYPSSNAKLLAKAEDYLTNKL